MLFTCYVVAIVVVVVVVVVVTLVKRGAPACLLALESLGLCWSGVDPPNQPLAASVAKWSTHIQGVVDVLTCKLHLLVFLQVINAFCEAHCLSANTGYCHIAHMELPLA